jgi:hypothetical protein
MHREKGSSNLLEQEALHMVQSHVVALLIGNLANGMPTPKEEK